MTHQKLLDDRQVHLKNLQNRLVKVLVLKETASTKGWQSQVQPLIDKSIRDIIGGKADDNMWDGGGLMNFKDKSPDFYMGYRQGLIDLNNRIWLMINSEKKLQDQIVDMKKEPKVIEQDTMEQSPYYPEEGLYEQPK